MDKILEDSGTGNNLVTLLSYLQCMSSYKEIQLLAGTFGMPVKVKLNREDGYVRVADPFHKVLKVEPQFFNHHHLVVSNLYGVPVFHLHAHGTHSNHFEVNEAGRQTLSGSFAEGAPNKGSIVLNVHHQKQIVNFEFQSSEQLADDERQMATAALVCCFLESNAVGRNNRKMVSS